MKLCDVVGPAIGIGGKL